MSLRQSARPQRTRHKCERRSSKRLLCSDLVKVSWADHGGVRHSEIAILENLSLAGVGLFLGVGIVEGCELQISANDTCLTGRVAGCRFRENGYLIGVELDSDSRWAQEPNSGFLPEHLLDVSMLRFD